MAPVSPRLLIYVHAQLNLRWCTLMSLSVRRRGAESGAEKVSKSDATLSGCLDCSCVTFKMMQVTSSPFEMSTFIGILTSVPQPAASYVTGNPGTFVTSCN